jgi:Activator of Hsp90 ATPase homolog 1-like protein
MTHQDFTTTISVDQKPDDAYSAILRVADWWTGTNEGKWHEAGDEFTHRHGESHYCQIRVTELVPGRKVSWLVLDNRFAFVQDQDQDEWTGTQITFEIAETEGRTRIRFAHLGLVPEFECFDACSNAWGSLINGNLRTLITKGRD